MKRSRQASVTVLATMLFLVIALDSKPSDTAVADPYRLSDGFTEETELQELADWVMEPRSGQAGSRKLRVFTSGDLDAALDSQTPRASLFSAEREQEARRQMLLDMPFGDAIAQAAERHEVDPLLLAAIVEAESRFRPDATSHRGAVGLMQVMPATGRYYGAKDLKDPFVNIDVGSRYLRALLQDCRGDVELALAAYNAGPGAVQQWGGIPPFEETRAYVKKVYARYLRHQQKARLAVSRYGDPFVAPEKPEDTDRAMRAR
ncbi:MAG TPA: lytic transglycosylase domain-containing protein [Thermoanaerobaculia bacterium]|nr:lytic transglycosylase domain-containing protein [Thermoanaerobaculia bacterium]